MKKSIFTISAIIALALSTVSCRQYERDQDRLDKESEGKGALLKAESTKKVAIEQSKAELESAKLDAQTKLQKTEANAQATVINAKASAEARLIEAESQAKANDVINKSLTPELIEYLRANKWNGQLPQTVAGSGVNTIIGLK